MVRWLLLLPTGTFPAQATRAGLLIKVELFTKKQVISAFPTAPVMTKLVVMGTESATREDPPYVPGMSVAAWPHELEPYDLQIVFELFVVRLV
jgi:hypothetical protein